MHISIEILQTDPASTVIYKCLVSYWRKAVLGFLTPEWVGAAVWASQHV